MKKRPEYNHLIESGYWLAEILIVLLFMNIGMAVPPQKAAADSPLTNKCITKLPAGVVKNIVIVHGAFADGSGYRKLFDILSKKGFNVTIVQNPLTSLKDDIDTTLRTLDKQDG